MLSFCLVVVFLTTELLWEVKFCNDNLFEYCGTKFQLLQNVKPFVILNSILPYVFSANIYSVVAICHHEKFCLKCRIFLVFVTR